MNCLAENSDVKANSPRVFLFFIYSLFHTKFCRFDVRYNNISVSISSPESDSELRAMNSAIAHFAILQETISQYALTLCHTVFSVLCLPAVPCPALRPPWSQCALTLCHAVFPVLRLPALRCPALRLNVRSHCVTQCFLCCVSLPCAALPCVSMCAHTVSRSVSCAASPRPALPCPTSQCAPGLTTPLYIWVFVNMFLNCTVGRSCVSIASRIYVDFVISGTSSEHV